MKTYYNSCVSCVFSHESEDLIVSANTCGGCAHTGWGLVCGMRHRYHSLICSNLYLIVMKSDILLILRDISYCTRTTNATEDNCVHKIYVDELHAVSGASVFIIRAASGSSQIKASYIVQYSVLFSLPKRRHA